jgi:hypothetical protein
MLSTQDFKDVLTQTIGDLRDVEHEAVLAVVNEYAPRLAALGESDDPEGERDDILTNVRLRLASLGIQGETAAGQAVAKVIQVAVNYTVKLALL